MANGAIPHRSIVEIPRLAGQLAAVEDLLAHVVDVLGLCGFIGGVGIEGWVLGQAQLLALAVVVVGTGEGAGQLAAAQHKLGFAEGQPPVGGVNVNGDDQARAGQVVQGQQGSF